ncbi:MAG TPA: hypothetical protein V6D50_12750 [Chroococcales cyanobacterium]|jgi:hypothetical protein
MKKVKSTLYPIFIFLGVLGLIGLGLGLLQISIWIEPQSPDTSSLPVLEPSSSPSVETAKQPSPVSPSMSSTSPTPVASPSKSPDPADVAAQQGGLRVSNLTEHPVRIALLAQKSSTKTYGEPAHWDFAPMEGGTQGLILSLPQENLKLKKGDILVAFAQDGSRSYWGPYVVGETSSPVWDRRKTEWELMLKP